MQVQTARQPLAPVSSGVRQHSIAAAEIPEVPYFVVFVHGRGIDLPVDGEEGSIAGFFTSRVVKSANVEAAKKLAMEMLAEEWRVGPNARANRGGPPTCVVEDVSEIGLVRRLLRQPAGYTFYPREK